MALTACSGSEDAQKSDAVDSQPGSLAGVALVAINSGETVPVVDSGATTTVVLLVDAGCNVCAKTVQSILRVRARPDAVPYSVRVAVSRATIEQAREWAALAQVSDTIPILSDIERLVRTASGASGVPAVLVVRRDGSIATTVLGNIDDETAQDERLESAIRTAMR